MARTKSLEPFSPVLGAPHLLTARKGAARMCAAAPDDPPGNAPKARGAFAAMCLGDRAAYKAWALARIAADRPARLLPAHGGAVAGPGLREGLREIVEML